MPENNESISQIADLVEKFFKTSFNNKPGKIGVSLDERSLIIHLEDFMGSQMENLVKSHDPDALRSVQELMVEHLIPSLTERIQQLTGVEAGPFYYDWADHDLSCVLVSLLGSKTYRDKEDYYLGKDAIHQQIGKITYEIEKVPDATYSYWAADHVLVIVREGILIKLEKAFIEQGATEVLRKVKRNLEKKVVFQESRVEEILKRKLKGIYLDWSFHENNSLLIYVFEN
ncbi:Na-translocating system protein MpsC family protein [Saccharibacillus alkalitolerans]|uniref:DUF2294 family protein n=1 Tax=Saccharibacillus alkalitolerans TaxID=2705290 RepID=A0ABX0FBA7_9BACL|nr:Na-translocating system protein MpsC family protein [Saccharibacillus alkalitolerans]NGZ77650.1 DUF2294 family protein [Saccharibacillus alkalitolerans]